MKTKYLQTNPTTGEPEAFVALSVQEIILIKEAVDLYKGDVDDPMVIKIKQELKEGLHNAWKQLRPSSLVSN
jgi:hypothetical protein